MTARAPGNFTVGLDLAQVHDYSVVAVVERQERITRYPWGDRRYGDAEVDDYFNITNLRRWDHGTGYPDIVAEVGAMLKMLGIMGAPIILDASGIGGPPAALFREAWRGDLGDSAPWPIIITGSQTPAQRSHVPRGVLLSELRIKAQQRRIAIAADLSLKDALVRELAELRLSKGPKGADLYESGEHDDLVLAVSMATWSRMRHYCGACPVHARELTESGGTPRQHRSRGGGGVGACELQGSGVA